MTKPSLIQILWFNTLALAFFTLYAFVSVKEQYITIDINEHLKKSKTLNNILFLVPGVGRDEYLKHTKDSVEKVFQSMNHGSDKLYNIECIIYIYKSRNLFNITYLLNTIGNKCTFIDNINQTIYQTISHHLQIHRKRYDYIYIHLDDVTLPINFNMIQMVEWLECNSLDVLTNSVAESVYKCMHPKTPSLQARIGREISTFETFSVLFKQEALKCIDKIVWDHTLNLWGWYYENFYKQYCNLSIGILDIYVSKHIGYWVHGTGLNRSYDDFAAQKSATNWKVQTKKKSFNMHLAELSAVSALYSCTEENTNTDYYFVTLQKRLNKTERINRILQDISSMQVNNIENIGLQNRQCVYDRYNDRHPISSHFDAIFVITMPNRKEYMKEIIRYYGLNHTNNRNKLYIFDAIQLEHNPKQIDKLVSLGLLKRTALAVLNSTKRNKYGDIGCYLSHLAIYYYIYTHSACIRTALIFEDDVAKKNSMLLKRMFFKNFNETMYVMTNKIDVNWEWINFGRCFDYCKYDQLFYESNINIVRSVRPLCLSSYGISYAGIKTLLQNNLLPMKKVLDHSFIDAISMNANYHTYSTSPTLFDQNADSGSNIDILTKNPRKNKKKSPECVQMAKGPFPFYVFQIGFNEHGQKLFYDLFQLNGIPSVYLNDLSNINEHHMFYALSCTLSSNIDLLKMLLTKYSNSKYIMNANGNYYNYSDNFLYFDVENDSFNKVDDFFVQYNMRLNVLLWRN